MISWSPQTSLLMLMKSMKTSTCRLLDGFKESFPTIVFPERLRSCDRCKHFDCCDVKSQTKFASSQSPLLLQRCVRYTDSVNRRIVNVNRVNKRSSIAHHRNAVRFCFAPLHKTKHVAASDRCNECALLEPIHFVMDPRIELIESGCRPGPELCDSINLSRDFVCRECLQLLCAQKLYRSLSIFKIMKLMSTHTTKRFRCALLLPQCVHTWASMIIKIDALWFLSKKPHKSRSPGVSWKIKIALLSDQVLTTFCPIFLLYRRKKVCFGPFFLGFWALSPGPPKLDFLTLFS